MKKLIVITGIFILCWSLIGCNNPVKGIKAQYFTISYGETMFDAINRVDTETVDLLVNNYNNIELTSMTTEEINYGHAITITFINNDQISGQITIDDKGIFLINGKNSEVENYMIEEDNEFYETALEVFYDLKEDYEKWFFI